MTCRQLRAGYAVLEVGLGVFGEDALEPLATGVRDVLLPVVTTHSLSFATAAPLHVKLTALMRDRATDLGANTPTGSLGKI